MTSKDILPTDIDSGAPCAREAASWAAHLSHVSAAIHTLTDPSCEEKARDHVYASLRACQDDDEQYKFLLRAVQDPWLHDALLDAHQEFRDIWPEDIIEMILTHYRDTDPTRIKPFMRRLYTRYSKTHRMSYVVRFLHFAPKDTFDALHMTQFLEKGYADAAIDNYHAFSYNALESLMYWVDREYPEYIHLADRLFEKLPLEDMGRFLIHVTRYNAERQKSILRMLLRRNVDDAFLQKARAYFSNLSDDAFSVMT